MNDIEKNTMRITNRPFLTIILKSILFEIIVLTAVIFIFVPYILAAIFFNFMMFNLSLGSFFIGTFNLLLGLSLIQLELENYKLKKN